jgi:hypothetical protein
MPFVADKIMALLKNILKKGAAASDDPSDPDAHMKALAHDEAGRGSTIKSKIKTVA